jgi:uncharacterized RDD family membrane protein YckC
MEGPPCCSRYVIVPAMENRVGFGLRLGAWALDLVALIILATVLTGVVAGLFPDALARFIESQLAAQPAGAPAAAKAFAEKMLNWSFAATLVGLLYSLTEAFAGWSVGKLILRIRIVDESGQRGPTGKLVLRWAIKQSGNLLLLAGLFAASKLLYTAGQIVALGIFLGCFLVLSKSRQALHDKIAGTAVLRKSDVGVAATAAPTPAASL